MSADIDVVAGPSGADRPERLEDWPLNLFETLRRPVRTGSGPADRREAEARR